MRKSKNRKTLKLNQRLLTRPRLDPLFDRKAGGESDAVGLQAGIQSPIAEAGQSPVLGALLASLESALAAEQEAFLAEAPALRTDDSSEGNKAHWDDDREAGP